MNGKNLVDNKLSEIGKKNTNVCNDGTLAEGAAGLGFTRNHCACMACLHHRANDKAPRVQGAPNFGCVNVVAADSLSYGAFLQRDVFAAAGGGLIDSNGPKVGMVQPERPNLERHFLSSIDTNSAEYRSSLPSNGDSLASVATGNRSKTEYDSLYHLHYKEQCEARLQDSASQLLSASVNPENFQALGSGHQLLGHSKSAGNLISTEMDDPALEMKAQQEAGSKINPLFLTLADDATEQPSLVVPGQVLSSTHQTWQSVQQQHVNLAHMPQQIWSNQFHPNQPLCVPGHSDGAEYFSTSCQNSGNSVLSNGQWVCPFGESSANGVSDNSVTLWLLLQQLELIKKQLKERDILGKACMEQQVLPTDNSKKNPLQPVVPLASLADAKHCHKPNLRRESCHNLLMANEVVNGAGGLSELVQLPLGFQKPEAVAVDDPTLASRLSTQGNWRICDMAHSRHLGGTPPVCTLGPQARPCNLQSALIASAIGELEQSQSKHFIAGSSLVPPANQLQWVSNLTPQQIHQYINQKQFHLQNFSRDLPSQKLPVNHLSTGNYPRSTT